jgi:hypothetical protein
MKVFVVAYHLMDQVFDFDDITIFKNEEEAKAFCEEKSKEIKSSSCEWYDYKEMEVKQ